MTEHSIVKIKLVNPDLSSDEESYVIEILSPRIYKDDFSYSVPKRIIYEIDEETELTLQLLPTTMYYPIAKYQVNYYIVGKRTPIDQQVWVVPPTTPLPYTATVQDGKIPIPEKFYQIIETNFEAAYTRNQNLFIINPVPAEGTVINLTYKSYLTLFDVLEKDPPGNSSPIRYHTYI